MGITVPSAVRLTSTLIADQPVLGCWRSEDYACWVAPPKKTPASRLAVSMDASPLTDDAARTLWVEFSAYMDSHEGDFDGYAKLKGWASVKTEHRAGRAVLVVSTK